MEAKESFSSRFSSVRDIKIEKLIEEKDSKSTLITSNSFYFIILKLLKLLVKINNC